MMMFVMLLVGTVALLAQDVEPPADWTALIEGFSVWFGTFAGLAAAATFLSGVVNGLVKAQNKFLRQALAWVVGIALAALGNIVNVGFLAEAPWLMTIVYGLGAGLAANGLFDVTLIRAIILALESALNNPKPTE